MNVRALLPVRMRVRDPVYFPLSGGKKRPDVTFPDPQTFRSTPDLHGRAAHGNGIGTAGRFKDLVPLTGGGKAVDHHG